MADVLMRKWAVVGGQWPVVVILTTGHRPPTTAR
jgi:hypothetical protein